MAKRQMTKQDQLDLVLFLGLLMAALMIGAVVWKAKGTGQVAAFATQSGKARVAQVQANSPDFSVSAPANIPSLPLVNVETTGSASPIALKNVDSTPLDPTLKVQKTAPKSVVETKLFGGEKYRYLKTIRMRVTAYAPDARCCWPFPGTTTASGASVKTNKGKLVAADTNVLPFHSLVSVPGYHGGETVPVLDRGGAIKGHKLDVMLPTYEMAQGWGAKMVDVKVYVPE